jgi:YVTN family beta-propeller protein
MFRRLALGIALTAGFSFGQYAYVTNPTAGTVSVISTATHAVTASINMGEGSYPLSVALTNDRTKAYVVIQTGSVAVISTATNTVTATINFAAGVYPKRIAITPDDSKAYVTYMGDAYEGGGVMAITLASGVATPIPVYGQPTFIAASNSKVYFSNLIPSSYVGVIDTSTNSVATTIPLTHQVQGMALSPDGSQLWISDPVPGTNAVLVYATAGNTLAATIPFPSTGLTLGAPGQIAFSPDGSKAFVSNSFYDTVTTVSATSPYGLGLFNQIGASPGPLAVSTDGSEIYTGFSGGVSVALASGSPYAHVTGTGSSIGGIAVGNAGTPAATPTVTSVSPNSGPTAGGTVVTITGTNLAGATAVTIGGAPVPSFTVVNATTISATVPAGTAGARSVVVTTPSGASAANSLFTYTATAPVTVPALGGTALFLLCALLALFGYRQTRRRTMS